ncbi:MAG: hypothetical protein IJT77_09790, partial [Clostridia bacterium]|nr:hypothetical protein [Clostridia bacterium]
EDKALIRKQPIPLELAVSFCYARELALFELHADSCRYIHPDSLSGKAEYSIQRDGLKLIEL